MWGVALGVGEKPPCGLPSRMLGDYETKKRGVFPGTLEFFFAIAKFTRVADLLDRVKGIEIGYACMPSGNPAQHVHNSGATNIAGQSIENDLE